MAKEFAKKFYNSPQWKRCRDIYIKERIKQDGGMCEKCRDEPGEEVHHREHLTPANITDPRITLNSENLQLLCKHCHFEEHKKSIMESFRYMKRERVTNNGLWFDECGQVHMREVKIVYGPPRSGKTSYVNRHRNTGDFILDVDAIISALLGEDTRRIHNNALYLALDIRDMVFEKIRANDGNIDCKTVWIIGGFPEKDKRELLAQELGAELIYMDEAYETCLSRSLEADLYGDKLYSEFVVNEWWRRASPP